LGAPRTADKLRAVGGCFLCPVFVGIVGFLKRYSRAQASMMEGWGRDFLLCLINQFLGSFGHLTVFVTKSVTNPIK